MKKITLSYEQAIDRLQTIVDALDNGKLELDQLSAHLKEAQDLLKYCKKRLQQTEKGRSNHTTRWGRINSQSLQIWKRLPTFSK